MSVIKCTCIDKIRKSNGQIFGYTLQAIDGTIANIEHDELKSKMKSHQIIVDNLQIAADGRLMDKAPLIETVEDAVSCINYVYNTNKNSVYNINSVQQKSNTSFEIAQVYKMSGGSDDVWSSTNIEWRTLVSLNNKKIKTVTIKITEEDGSDVKHSRIKETIQRTDEAEATKTNLIMYSLAFTRDNNLQYTELPRQQGLMYKKEKLELNTNNTNNTPDKPKKASNIIGYNNGHEIIKGVSKSGLHVYNSIDYWNSLDPEEKQKEVNDPESPWYKYNE